MTINFNRRGQSLMEVIIVLPILISFWAAMVWFARVFIIKMELMMAARHGIFVLAYNHDDTSSDEERVLAESECLQYLRKADPSLAAGLMTISVNPGDRWKAFGPSNLTKLPQLFNLMTGLKKMLKSVAGLGAFKPASITIDYQLPAPPLLRAIPGFPPTIPLRGFCVCYR